MKENVHVYLYGCTGTGLSGPAFMQLDHCNVFGYCVCLWHFYEKNKELKPEYFAANSGKKVWWKCKEGHEWQAIIADRNRGNGCPYCSGRKK